MTKKIRIENADTTTYAVAVQVWEKGALLPDGMGGFNQSPDVLVREQRLEHPCQMADDLYLTPSNYVVVKEA